MSAHMSAPPMLAVMCLRGCTSAGDRGRQAHCTSAGAGGKQAQTRHAPARRGGQRGSTAQGGQADRRIAGGDHQSASASSAQAHEGIDCVLARQVQGRRLHDAL